MGKLNNGTDDAILNDMIGIMESKEHKSLFAKEAQTALDYNPLKNRDRKPRKSPMGGIPKSMGEQPDPFSGLGNEDVDPDEVEKEFGQPMKSADYDPAANWKREPKRPPGISTNQTGMKQNYMDAANKFDAGKFEDEGLNFDNTQDVEDVEEGKEDPFSGLTNSYKPRGLSVKADDDLPIFTENKEKNVILDARRNIKPDWTSSEFESDDDSKDLLTEYEKDEAQDVKDEGWRGDPWSQKNLFKEEAAKLVSTMVKIADFLGSRGYHVSEAVADKLLNSFVVEAESKKEKKEKKDPKKDPKKDSKKCVCKDCKKECDADKCEKGKCPKCCKKK